LPEEGHRSRRRSAARSRRVHRIREAVARLGERVHDPRGPATGTADQARSRGDEAAAAEPVEEPLGRDLPSVRGAVRSIEHEALHLRAVEAAEERHLDKRRPLADGLDPDVAHPWRRELVTEDYSLLSRGFAPVPLSER